MLGGDLLLAKLASSGEARLGGHSRALVSAQRKAVGIDVQMLVDEREQVRALLLDPVKRRGLARPFRSGRECRMFVKGEAAADRRSGVLGQRPGHERRECHKDEGEQADDADGVCPRRRRPR